MLLLTNDLVQASPEHADWFVDMGGEADGMRQPYGSLVKLLDSKDAYVAVKAAQFAAIFLYADNDAPERALDRVLEYVSGVFTQANSSTDADDSTPIVLVVLALSFLLG